MIETRTTIIRNVVVHAYQVLDLEIVKNVILHGLDNLLMACDLLRKQVLIRQSL